MKKFLKITALTLTLLMLLGAVACTKPIVTESETTTAESEAQNTETTANKESEESQESEKNRHIKYKETT